MAGAERRLALLSISALVGACTAPRQVMSSGSQATTRVTLTISYPRDTHLPCSTFFARVRGCHLDLGTFCGQIRENPEAATGALNLEGYSGEKSGPGGRLWQFRATRSQGRLVFQRRDHDQGNRGWRAINSCALPSATALTTEIAWPSKTWPMPTSPR